MVRKDLGKLWAIVLASTALYVGLARIDAVNGAGPVLRFLGILGLLFGLYAVAGRIFLRLPSSPAALSVMGVGAIAFRLALLPAG